MISPRLNDLLRLLGSIFLIVLGVLLLQLQTPFDTISAIDVSGYLFFLIGITGIGGFVYRIIRQYWNIYSANPPTVKSHHQIDDAGTGPPETLLKICPVCEEAYPESTIHTVCIMCGSPLDSQS